MKTLAGQAHRFLLCIALTLCVAPCAQAQRELHWDALDVTAHLRADGILDVIERHTLVFTGDWNGGERVFNVRPRQKLEFVGMQRVDTKAGSLLPLRETSAPDNVDEFTWTDRRTLRWRSRLPSDPPFANTKLTYDLHYRLSGVLLRDDEEYRIDHDFAFPNRPGPIERFTLTLDLDPVWHPLAKHQDRYSAGPLAPGESFVLDLPLHYSGAVEPAAIDTQRPPEIVVAVIVIPGLFAFLVLLFVRRERELGRFAAVDAGGVNKVWIEGNVLTYPAEVVGAVWDGRIGTPEVVALIARLTAEGKLESKVENNNSMRLALKVDRGKFSGHEKALVDGLFFGDRTETSTSEVRRHYENRGFDPAGVIKPELEKQVKKLMRPSEKRVRHRASPLLFAAGFVLLVWSAVYEPVLVPGVVAAATFALVIGVLLQVPGWLFRARIDWGLEAAAFLLIPAALVSLGAALLLWWSAGAGEVDLPWTMTGALTVLSLAIVNASINGMKSRQSREALALRKRLAKGRSFFLRELKTPQPDLRDAWYPWLLAFGLGKQVDAWSTLHTTTATDTSTPDYTPASSSSSSSMNTGWSGGGGHSGGAGASGSWAAVATGMAAGVAAPGSSDSGGSSGGGGGSSGGGGGGGW